VLHVDVALAMCGFLTVEPVATSAACRTLSVLQRLEVWSPCMKGAVLASGGFVFIACGYGNQLYNREMLSEFCAGTQSNLSSSIPD
jgi:hypothetical protein